MPRYIIPTYKMVMVEKDVVVEAPSEEWAFGAVTDIDRLGAPPYETTRRKPDIVVE